MQLRFRKLLKVSLIFKSHTKKDPKREKITKAITNFMILDCFSYNIVDFMAAGFKARIQKQIKYSRTKCSISLLLVA